MDTASDYGLLVEWYNLMIAQQNEPANIEPQLDMRAMFICCVAVLLFYRLYSSFRIYQLTKSKMNFIYQFLFDYGLIKAMYVNIINMHSLEVLGFTKAFRSLEGMAESLPQAVLVLVFLLKSENNYNFIAWFSFSLSMYSLVSRVMAIDDPYFIETWKKINIEATNILQCNFCFSVNRFYLYRLFYRIIDITTTVLLHGMIWHVFGGQIHAIIAAVFFVGIGCFRVLQLGQGVVSFMLSFTNL